ncbi:MAG: ArsR family transcriptional regulator [Nanoarchaeota archaeon]
MATSSGNSNGKRTFKEIRKEILLCLSKGQMTVNEIAVCAKINWKTVDNHLIHLSGRGLVREVFNSAYVRIYELAEEGKDFLLANFSDKIKIENKKKYAVKTARITLL